MCKLSLNENIKLSKRFIWKKTWNHKYRKCYNLFIIQQEPLKMNGTIAISVSLFCLVSQNYFDFYIPRLYISSVFFSAYFLKQLKLKPKIVCYTTLSEDMPFQREFVELTTARPVAVCHGAVWYKGVTVPMTREEWHHDWKVCPDRGAWGAPVL